MWRTSCPVGLAVLSHNNDFLFSKYFLYSTKTTGRVRVQCTGGNVRVPLWFLYPVLLYSRVSVVEENSSQYNVSLLQAQEYISRSSGASFTMQPLATANGMRAKRTAENNDVDK
jgi:hypothetical protein